MTEWRPCPGFPAYEVSENGDVRRIVFSKGFHPGYVLGGRINTSGYRAFDLRRGGQRFTVYAQRLVCEAWHGPAPSSRHQAAHFDGNKLNNHHSNLRWASRKENNADKLRHGTDHHGERHPSAKLTWADVRAIRAEHTGDAGQNAELARRYGVSKHQISRIVAGVRWREPAETAA